MVRLLYMKAAHLGNVRFVDVNAFRNTLLARLNVKRKVLRRLLLHLFLRAAADFLVSYFLS
jgi:hypothetical protein